MIPYQEPQPYTGGHYMMGYGGPGNAVGMYGGMGMMPYAPTMNAREFEMELSGIRSVDEI